MEKSTSNSHIWFILVGLSAAILIYFNHSDDASKVPADTDEFIHALVEKQSASISADVSAEDKAELEQDKIHFRNRSTIIHGAMGRHNFGDVLMPHILTQLLLNAGYSQSKLIYTDVLPRDMRPLGGFETKSILDYLKSSTVHGTGVYNVIIAGGEVGGCTVDCAHGMFTTHDEKYSKKEAATLKKSRDFDTKSLAYILKKSQFQDAGAFIANTIGGGMHNDELEDYDFVSYRNSPPKYKNVSPVMAPDSVLAIKELFDERIQAYSHSSFSDMKYIAVQIRKSTFRDQKIYGIIARELDKLSNNQSLPIIFFRAGAATHHDSLSTYRDLGKRMSSEYYIMEDLDIWKICALISRAQLQVSTSMHTRIIAYAYQVPRVTLDAQGKHNALIGSVDKHVKSFSVAGSRNFADTAIRAMEHRDEFHKPERAEATAKQYITNVFNKFVRLL